MALTAFLSYAVLAGGNAVCIRFSNRELSPLWGASLRFALAAALLLAVMLMFKLAFPRGRALAGSLLYGLFNIGAGFGLIYYGLVQIHAGLAQILLALVPLATLLLAVLWRQERLHAAAVMGTLLALAGVAVVSRSPLRKDVPMLSVLAVIGGAICCAQVLVLVRRFPRVHPQRFQRLLEGAVNHAAELGDAGWVEWLEGRAHCDGSGVRVRAGDHGEGSAGALHR